MRAASDRGYTVLTSLDECLLSGQIICTLYAMEYNLKAHHYLQCHVYTMQHTRICMQNESLHRKDH